jgi:hypothetical protein
MRTNVHLKNKPNGLVTTASGRGPWSEVRLRKGPKILFFDFIKFNRYKKISTKNEIKIK